MRRLLAVTLFAAGCASSSPPATAPAAPPPPPPPPAATGAAAPPAEAPKPEPAQPAPPPLAQQPEADAPAANAGILGSAITISLELTPPTVSKGGDPKAVANTLSSNEGVLLGCGTAPHESTTTMILKFRIDTTGKVARATATGDKQLDDCIAHRIKAMTFPAATVAVDVVEKLGVAPPAFASLTGTGDISSGFDDTNIYSGKVPAVAIGEPSAKGDLDKAIIRRYIKRNIQKIQYCYEKQLASSPKLAGTATVTFHIGVDGKVTSSTGSGFAKVDECVAQTIKAIEFPKPKSGGDVEVVYPFTFRPAN